MRFETSHDIVYEEHFDGSVSSSDKADAIRLDVAQEVMEELIERAPWEPRPIAETELARLHARCATLSTENRSVRGCLLRIVSHVGDKRFLPILEASIREPVDRVPDDHIHAINAYARLSGIDLREGKVTWDNVRTIRGRYLAHLDALPDSKPRSAAQDK